jgi:2-iminobutanoate/2-iminopropanoate deaminase
MTIATPLTLDELKAETQDRANRQAHPCAGVTGEEARQALANLDAVLRAGGSRRDLVLKTTVFVRDIELWDAVNAVYAEFFGAHRPSRSIVPTGPLHFGLLVEIEAVAALA